MSEKTMGASNDIGSVVENYITIGMPKADALRILTDNGFELDNIYNDKDYADCKGGLREQFMYPAFFKVKIAIFVCFQNDKVKKTRASLNSPYF